MTALYRVVLHMEKSVANARDITWWADSPDLDGWTASAQTLVSLRELVIKGVAFFAEQDDVAVQYFMNQPSPPSEGPESFETINSSYLQTPPSQGLQASTLVSA